MGVDFINLTVQVQMVRCESLKLFNDRTTGVFFLPEKSPTEPSVIYFLSCHEVETATDRPTKVLQ